jgi:superfamily II DNA or RNA helicase
MRDSIDLAEHLSTLDHGQLARLLRDARLVELVTAVMQSRRDVATSDRGQLILDLSGGAEAILEDAPKRKELFLTMSGSNRDKAARALGVPSLEKFRLSADRRTILYQLFGLQVPHRQQEELLPAVSSVGVEYGLFPHQTDALLNCRQYIESDIPKVMLHMPTGSGKTRTAMHLICRHLNNRRQGLVVWLVSGKELCEQAAAEFRKAWATLGERALPLVCAWEGRRSVDLASFERTQQAQVTNSFQDSIWPETLEDGMIVGGLATVWGMTQRWEPGELIRHVANVTLLVFDEAHRSAATTYAKVVESISGSSECGLLGLSATPGRTHYGGSLDDTSYLVELFGQQMVQLAIPGFSSPVEGLIAQGYLARLEKEKLTVAESGLSRTALRDLGTRLETALDLPEETLRHLGLNATRNLQIIERVEKLVKDQGHLRVIVFAPSVESSNLLASLLRTRGINAASITANTDAVARSAAIAAYRKEGGNASVLCNYGVLTTGFDAPKTSAVVIARPTLSIVLLNQMAGRAIRGPKIGGNQSALLVTVVDTSIPALVDTINQFHAFDASWSKDPNYA